MAVTAAELLKLVESVLAAAKKAEGGDTAEQRRAVDGLKVLRQQRVSTKMLAETQAGRRVKSLAKHPKADVAAAAAEAVAAWKEAVRQEASDGGLAASGAAASGATSSKATGGGSGRSAAKGDDLPSSQQTVASSAAAVIDPDTVPRSGDAIRDKCRQNLASAFALAVGEGVAGDPVVAAVAVENELFKQHGGVTQAYKAKFRNLHFNLKDPANPDLRRKVLSGDIAPDSLVVLPPEDLASDAKREENRLIREKKLFDSAPSAAKQATTDQFQCGKCRQRKCTYYQMQTRSADEPMTTFVSCLNCNNRWKFC